MKVLPLALAGLIAGLILLAGCVSPAATEQKSSAAPLPDGAAATLEQAQAIMQRVGENATARATSAVKAELLLVGKDAAEPTLGVLKDGTLFYAASTFNNDIAGVPFNQLPRTDILRSTDGAATWKDVTPYFPGGLVREHPETGDPMVYVDTDTGRVFDIDQRGLVACYTVVTSDDKGATWTTPPSAACVAPPADHQTIVAAKPRTLPVTPLYPKIVYVCYNSIATTTCSRSLDGGRTFEATGPVGTKGVQPDHAADVAAGDPSNFLCSALVGHLKAAPDGTVYLPRRECDKPLLAITQDDGLTWKLVQVSSKKAYNGGGTAGMDPTIAVDKAGNVYYVFQGADGHLWLTTSSDHGSKWTEAVDITPAGVTWANLAAIAPGSNGTIAAAYYGTNLTDGIKAKADAVKTSTWSGYLAVVTDALTPTPTVTTARVNPADDPLYRGACGIGRCGSVRDFIDIVVDGDGRPWAAFVDACVKKCATSEGTDKDSTSFTGAIATLTDGFSLWDPTVALPPVHAVGAK